MATWFFALFLLAQSPLDQANKALLEGNYDQAYSLYRQVLSTNPNEYNALVNGAFAASKIGKTSEAFDLYWRAWQIKQDPQQVGRPLETLGLQLGTKYTLEKRWGDAERVFRIVTSVNPRNDVAWFNLGYALEQQGKLEEALTAYRRARDLNASNTVLAALNRVQRELDRQRIARLNTFRRRAEQALSRGDTTRALAFMDSILRLDPRNAWARDTRTQILEQQRTQALIDSLHGVLAGLLAQDSLRALPVVEQLLTLTPEDSQLLALKATLEALKQRRIQLATQPQKAEKKGLPLGLIIGAVVVLLILIGAVLLLRGKRGEEVPTYAPPSPKPKPQPQPAPETPKPTPAPPPPPPPEPETPPPERAPVTTGKIRVVEGIPAEEPSPEEATPRDVVIRKTEEAPPPEPPPAPPTPPEKEAEEAAEAPPLKEEKPKKPAEPTPKAPPPEPTAPAKAEPEAAPTAPEPPKPTPPKEEKKKEEKKEEAKAPPTPPKPAPVRPRGFAGVNAIKERAKKKRRLLLLQMLREVLGQGQEGVFGSKELEAYIYIKEGKILQAEYKGKSGQEALQAILENPKPDRFSFREKDTFFVEGDLNITAEDLDRQIEELQKEVG